MFKTTAFFRIGGFEVGGIGREDYDLWFKALRMGCTFSKIPDQLYVHSLDTSVARIG